MRSFLYSAGVALFVAALTSAQITAQTSTNGALTGRWDFNQANLKATVGSDLQFVGQTGASSAFEQADIGGQAAHVLHFSDQSEGILLTHGAKANGGGTNVNAYTLVMDLMWPAESDATFRALFGTDTNNVRDPVMFLNPDNGVGVNNDYAGEMAAGNWYRLALAFDLTNSVVRKYLNGDLVGTQTLEGAVDSQYSLGPSLLLFASNAGEVRAGYVDRIDFYSEALNDDQVKSLGVPQGDGGPIVTGDVKIESITRVNNDVAIAISGGGRLQLQRQTALGGATWETAGEVNGSGTLTVPANGATGFFRVQRL